MGYNGAKYGGGLRSDEMTTSNPVTQKRGPSEQGSGSEGLGGALY